MRQGRRATTGRLLAVFAHPDDETYLAGGTLARYAASGCEVSVLCATFGEAGRRGEYASLSRRDFAVVRRRELEAACAALGVRPPLFLGCADQGLGRDCWDRATDEIVRTIRRLRPDVVLTFGPDGVSGHADHVALSQIVTAAFWGAGVTARWPLPAPRGDRASARRHDDDSRRRLW
jgi:LmbE family N-acetylglucosaminyl deacetylase